MIDPNARRPRLSRIPDAPFYNTDSDLFERWQALLDAGLIGHRPPTPPDVLANTLANEALFRRLAGR